MNTFDDRRDILAHGLIRRAPGPQVYRLICPAARITVRSQQTRALNLAWALAPELAKVAGTTVAVIGGGAAGIMFSACVALLHAKVDLYEKGRLMHLQRGSWHRPLHPEIYSWPDETAFRPVSHLPLFGWTTGSANDVANEIVSKFRVVQKATGDRLEVHEEARAALATNGELVVHALGRHRADPQRRRFDYVVIASGFGVEKNSPELPTNSYWRGDALDQPFLDESIPTVAISGASDGALIDLLRTCCPETDQGGFLDLVLAATLRDSKLREAVSKFDHPKFESKGRGRIVQGAYDELCEQEYPSLRAIDDFLRSRRRVVDAHWLYSSDSPFNDSSLPINRFLASRLIKYAGQYGLTLHPHTVLRHISPIANGRRLVELDENGVPARPLVCRQVLCRWGPRRHLEHSDVFESVAHCFETPTDIAALVPHFRCGDGHHGDCHRPRGWPADEVFLERLDAESAKPKLVAEFLTGFEAPSTKAPSAPWVYRLRIWLEGTDKNVSVRYALHPEEKNRPVIRVGIGQWHDQWINTRNDYQVRVHTGDGREWSVGTVLKALARRYQRADDALPEGADPNAEKPVPLRCRGDAESFKDAGAQSWEDALKTIERQTFAMRPRRIRSRSPAAGLRPPTRRTARRG